jgi:DNA-binding response OmpR family regulator
LRLRRKIEVDPENPRLLKTVRGVGDIFACDVSQA